MIEYLYELEVNIMLATIRNDLEGLFLALRLHELHGAYCWREDTGALLGSTYSSPTSAVQGLKRSYNEPGTIVSFRSELGQPGLSAVAVAL